MDISLDNIWFLGVRLVANTSNLNISKDIWKIILLLSYYKNLGYWWPFAVGFMSLCLLVSKLEHFKKSCQKNYFYRLGFIALFWETLKTTQLWTSAITNDWTHIVSWGILHSRFFGGFAGFARLLSSRVACVVVYAKVPWLSLHAKYRYRKAKQAAAPFF